MERSVPFSFNASINKSELNEAFSHGRCGKRGYLISFLYLVEYSRFVSFWVLCVKMEDRAL